MLIVLALTAGIFTSAASRWFWMMMCVAPSLIANSRSAVEFTVATGAAPACGMQASRANRAADKGGSLWSLSHTQIHCRAIGAPGQKPSYDTAFLKNWWKSKEATHAEQSVA
jgi:hypothetical protein